ncbi:hypothetical protein BDR07DRAFT_1378767 [Suillus spraguei]|nr:hypothetical protein BDR07DRAFT_1378767 [Suillus spraguei]
MDTPVHPQLRHKAKDQALENPAAVWGALQKKRTRKCERSPIDDIAPIPKRVRAKPVSKSDATKARTPAPLLRTENSKSSKRLERPHLSLQTLRTTLRLANLGGQRRKSDIDSDDASKQSASDRITNIEESDSDSEPVESIAEALFGEVPAIANAQQGKPVKSTSGRPRNDPSQSPTPPPPVWGSQFKSSSVKEKKYAAEVPMWDSPMTRSSFGPQPLKRVSKSNKRSSVVEEDEEDEDSVFDIKPEPSMSSLRMLTPWLILFTQRLGDSTRHPEVKAYIAFKHGYPELVAKNSYAREILLQAAKHHKTVPIEKRMYVDDEYLSALANLIFDAEGLPSPKRQKPYQGQPVVDTLYEFAQRFIDIAKNKASRPEVPIPMVAIVSTAIHATLIAKKNKAGNQFCDIYTYHVALLEKIRRTTPVKFHKMMADIYEEVQGFCRDTIGVYDKDTDLALLDLDGMDNE